MLSVAPWPVGGDLAAGGWAWWARLPLHERWPGIRKEHWFGVAGDLGSSLRSFASHSLCDRYRCTVPLL